MEEDFCKCFNKNNIKCAKCDKPYELPTTKQQQIDALKKRIRDNIKDLENEIEDEIYL